MTWAKDVNGHHLGLDGKRGGGGATGSNATGSSAPNGGHSSARATRRVSGATSRAAGTASSTATAGRRCSWWRCRPPNWAAARRRRSGAAGSRPAADRARSTRSRPCSHGGSAGSGSGNPTASTPASDCRIRKRGRRAADCRPSIGGRGGRGCHCSSHRCGRLASLSAPFSRGVKNKPEPPRVKPHIPQPSIVHVSHHVGARWREIVNNDRIAPDTAAGAQLQPLPGKGTVRGGESPKGECHLYRRPSASARTG